MKLPIYYTVKTILAETIMRITKISFIFFSLILTGCFVDDVKTNITNVIEQGKKNTTYAAPVNVNADWKVEYCTVGYKGQTLKLGTTIDEWEKILGKHDRFVNAIYVFDRYGIKLYEQKGVIISLVIKYETHPNYTTEEINRKEESSRDIYINANAARPKQVYTGYIDVDGGILQPYFAASPVIFIDEFNKQRLAQNPEAKKFTKGYMENLYHLYRHCDTDSQALVKSIGMRLTLKPENQEQVLHFSISEE